MAERALQMWSAASSLTFVRSTSASANIRFVNSVADDPNSTAGDTDPVAYARTSSNFSTNTIISSVIVISSNWTTLDPNAQAGWFDNCWWLAALAPGALIRVFRRSLLEMC